jgi:hypothetical protein
MLAEHLQTPRNTHDQTVGGTQRISGGTLAGTEARPLEKAGFWPDGARTILYLLRHPPARMGWPGSGRGRLGSAARLTPED